MTKKLLALTLSLCLVLSLFSTVGFTASAAATVTRFSSTSDSEIAQFMMGNDISTNKNLLFGAFPKQVYSSSGSSTTKYYAEATNTGSNGSNSYTRTGSNSKNHIAATFALTDGLAPTADNDIAFASNIWSASSHHITFEYDLGDVCNLNDFYVCFSSRSKGDERIVSAYELYASDSLSTLYSSPIFTISDNTDGMNQVTFPSGTTARYFAFRITKPDNGNPTTSVYPRCKEIALSGSHTSENWASLNPLNVTYSNDPGDNTLNYWMDGLAPTDPSNIILHKTPSITYYQPGSSTNVTGKAYMMSNGIFDDAYFTSPWNDNTYMLDSTYADVVWDLDSPSKFSEFWVTFRPEFSTTGYQFIMPKYALYCGNDKTTMFNSDPIILIDCNFQNVNKIKFNERTARYFGLRAICPNIQTWATHTRLSIQEAALIGPAKRLPNVSCVDSKGQDLDITIGGASTPNYDGEISTLTAADKVALGSKTYLFDGFFENDSKLPSTLSNDIHSTNITISAKNKIVVKYSEAVTVSNISSYVANNIMTNIGTETSSIQKIDSSYEISSDLSYQNYSLLGWMINSGFVPATSNGKHTIVLSSSTSIRAIYANAEGAEVVMFKANSGDQIATFIVQKGQAISSVVTPEKIAEFKMPLIFGYTHSGWSVDLDEPCNASVTITPTYTQNTETYPVSVDGSSLTNAKFDQKITLNSSKTNFSSYKNGDSVISITANETVYCPGKIDLVTETFGAGTQITDEAALVNGITWSNVSKKYNLSVLASINGIDEDDFIECGVVFAHIDDYNTFKTTDEFVISAKTISRSLTKYPQDGVYMITLSGINAVGQRAARAYVKFYKDGKETIKYSRSAITAKKDGSNMPNVKYDSPATKYAAHNSIKLYEDNAIPYYNATYAAKTINSSTEAGNNPTIAPYIVDGAKACVVIYPGGGYYQRSDNSEGVSIAKAYNNAGYSAFVVRYRCGNSDNYSDGYNDQAIITDGQRAVQFVRYHADEFGIDPNQIAVCGFSAGGHLAMSVSQNQMEKNVVGDRAGEISNIPNATILGYAVTTLLYGTFGSMPEIFGAHHTSEEKTAILNKYSGQLHAKATTPATFLFYGTADTAVSPTYNSIAYYNALITAGATAEIHAYEGLGHGFGLGSNTAAAEWHSKSVTFLKNVAGLNPKQ